MTDDNELTSLIDANAQVGWFNVGQQNSNKAGFFQPWCIMKPRSNSLDRIRQEITAGNILTSRSRMVVLEAGYAAVWNRSLDFTYMVKYAFDKQQGWWVFVGRDVGKRRVTVTQTEGWPTWSWLDSFFLHHDLLQLSESWGSYEFASTRYNRLVFWRITVRRGDCAHQST